MAWQSMLPALALIPSVFPRALGLAGPVYTVGALLLLVLFTIAGTIGCRKSNADARRLLFASISTFQSSFVLMVLNKPKQQTASAAISELSSRDMKSVGRADVPMTVGDTRRGAWLRDCLAQDSVEPIAFRQPIHSFALQINAF